MSIQPVNGNTTIDASTLSSTQGSAYKKGKADFDALTQALDSNNLSAAQAAYAALQQDVPAVAQATQSTTSNTTQTTAQTSTANSLDSIGTALASGNLSAAQSAFSNLQQNLASNPASSATQSDFSNLLQTLKSGGASGHHHHHAKAGGGSATAGNASTSSLSSTLSSASSSGSIDVTV